MLANNLNIRRPFSSLVASLVALVAIVGATLLASTTASAGDNPPPPPARIAVKVVDGDGKPVPGAIVELMYKGRPVRHEMTNRDGKAGFLRVIPAEYGIRAGKRGVGVAHDRVLAKSGETAAVLLTLKKPSTTGTSVTGDGSTSTSGTASTGASAAK